ncbi:MAG: hypothetical protein ACON4Z_12635 [Planctomycetota bacterium]
MSDSLRHTAPVRSVPGYAGQRREAPRHRGGSHGGHPSEPGRTAESKTTDGVEVHLPESIARRLLRERVLARTRVALGLQDGEFVPRFAEDVDAEPLAAFVGRLLGAQNQLAALRVGELSQPELRARLDSGLRAGFDEVVEMLSRDGDDEHTVAALAVVAAALAEYGRRLAELA